MIRSYVGGFLYNPKTREILLHKRDGNTNVNPHKWAFFGGLVEGEETPIEALIRELKEELGIVISPNEIEPLRDYFNADQDTHRYSFFVVSDKSKEEMILGEGADFDWIPLEKVFEYDLTDKVRNDLRIFLENKL